MTNDEARTNYLNALSILSDMRRIIFVELHEIRSDGPDLPILTCALKNELRIKWNQVRQLLGAVQEPQGVTVLISLGTRSAMNAMLMQDLPDIERQIIWVLQHLKDEPPPHPILAVLHPRIASECLPLLESGQHHNAISKAFGLLTTLLRARSASTLDGDKLVDHALASEQRIVLAIGDSPTAKNIQRGYQEMAKGAYAGIRNVYTHEPDMVTDKTSVARHLVLISTLIARIEAKPWSKMWRPAEPAGDKEVPL